MPREGDGWILHIKRLREEQRKGMRFARTIGAYQVYRDGKPIENLNGATVERQGPGDNSRAGKTTHARIKAGPYPLLIHRSKKYATRGYAKDGQPPRPAIEVGSTGDRSAILVHPAGGYGSTIGCINLAWQLAGPQKNISLPDSVARVVAIIENLKEYLGRQFPDEPGHIIPNAIILLEGEPL